MLCVESFCPQQKFTTERCSLAIYTSILSPFCLLKSASEYALAHQLLRLSWNWSCYLMMHIGNLLCPLQLFYFHLWPIYWPPHVCRDMVHLFVLRGWLNLRDDVSSMTN
jgi:hypothetical protein